MDGDMKPNFYFYDFLTRSLMKAKQDISSVPALYYT